LFVDFSKIIKSKQSVASSDPDQYRFKLQYYRE
jgi:hypothetical protein